MLHIQQASAGSGKTFTLAKTYIRNLLGVKDPGTGRYTLRNPDARNTEDGLRDAHSHILAITFTNKATNEMKQRIVQKLAAIAEATPDLPKKNKPDYLADLAQEFGVSEQAVILQAQRALQYLLHGYGDFHVSTIDSFFQTVLRSFTAEIDELSDNYQIELDDTLISQRSVDATMSQLRENDRSRPGTDELMRWIKMLIKRQVENGINWNPFNKNSDSSIYGQLMSFAAITTKESYKYLEGTLRDYFKQLDGHFMDVFIAVQAAADNDRRRASELFTRQYRRVAAMPGFDQIISKGPNGMAKFMSCLAGNLNRPIPSKPSADTTPRAIARGEKPLFQKKYNGKGEMDAAYPGLQEEVASLFTLFFDWLDIHKRWAMSIANLHQMGLLGIVMSNRREFLTDNNLIALSSTNQILRRIICEDDAPFIYERIGTYLDHYLIDEFQDTSSMQWENLRPLLRESLSRGCDNLIIGDVKQSIYRFRNAEPALISEVVPSDPELSISPEADGKSVTRSANWRSSREVVQFNNSLFTLLSRHLPEGLRAGKDIQQLYNNVVQQIINDDVPGHVRIDFVKRVKTGEHNPAYDRIGPIIADLISRGYQQREIAVLVNTNIQGGKVLDAIAAYNTCQEPENRINVISDESLKISSSEAVQIIISILELMQQPGQRSRRKSDIQLLLSRYHYTRLHNPDIPFDDIMQQHLADEQEGLDVLQMLRGMRSLALPSLIEAVAANYLSAHQRSAHAAYLAALQDIVLEYCENQAADLPSFLTWWYDKGCDRCISSPQSTQAVKVMTIHKSKGLEFECVILPRADWAFTPEKQETIWVEPVFPSAVDTGDLPLPPYIPITTSEALLESPYKAPFIEFKQKVLVDNINKTYVAFTRAKSELYIIADEAPANQKNEPRTLGPLLRMALSYIDELPNNPDHLNRSLWKSGTHEDEVAYYEYGSPTVVVDNDNNNTDNNNNNRKNISEYYTEQQRDILKCRAGDNDIPDDDPDKQDMLSPGRIMHEVMSRVETLDELPASLLREVVRGNLTAAEADRWKTLIYSQTDNPDSPIHQWFRPGLRVINERAILDTKGKNHRPDRVIIDNEGNATVVDYKFGNVIEPGYIFQVRDYMTQLSATGAYRNVNGYLWYVTLQKIIKVTSKF